VIPVSPSSWPEAAMLAMDLKTCLCFGITGGQKSSVEIVLK
jgi:hypothetical protein